MWATIRGVPPSPAPWAFLPDDPYCGLLALQNRLWYVPKTFAAGHEYRFAAEMSFVSALMAMPSCFLLACLLTPGDPGGYPLWADRALAVGSAAAPVFAYLGIYGYGLRTGRLFYRIEYSWGDPHRETVAWTRTNARGHRGLGPLRRWPRGTLGRRGPRGSQLRRLAASRRAPASSAWPGSGAAVPHPCRTAKRAAPC